VSEFAPITLRVTGIRSQNPRGFGGAIFTGVPVDSTGAVLDASPTAHREAETAKAHRG